MLCERQRLREPVTVLLIALDGDAVLDRAAESDLDPRPLLEADIDADELGPDEKLGLEDALGLYDDECESVLSADEEALDDALAELDFERGRVAAGDAEIFATERETVAVTTSDADIVDERHCVADDERDHCALRETTPVIVEVEMTERVRVGLVEIEIVPGIDFVGVEDEVCDTDRENSGDFDENSDPLGDSVIAPVIEYCGDFVIEGVGRGDPVAVDVVRTDALDVGECDVENDAIDREGVAVDVLLIVAAAD